MNNIAHSLFAIQVVAKLHRQYKQDILKWCMIIKPNIALDVDGVLFSFDDTFQQVAQQVLDRPVSKVSNHFRLYKKFGLSLDEVDKIWQAFTEKHYYQKLEPIEGALEAAKELSAHYNIHIVTAVRSQHAEDRKSSLAKHGFKEEQIHAVGGGNAPKDGIISQIMPIIFVDDRLEHLHKVPFVQHRVWVRTDDEQFPIEGETVTHEVDSLRHFTDEHLRTLETKRKMTP